MLTTALVDAGMYPEPSRPVPVRNESGSARSGAAKNSADRAMPERHHARERDMRRGTVDAALRFRNQRVRRTPQLARSFIAAQTATPMTSASTKNECMAAEASR